MKLRIFSSICITALVLTLAPGIATLAADGTASPSLPAAPPPLYHEGEFIQDPKLLLDPKVKQFQENNTLNLLDQQSRNSAAGTESSFTLQENLTIGKARATEMVEMLKSVEMKRALDKITAQGNDVLQNNPELKNPAGVIAGAAALWTGRTIKLIKDDHFKLATRIDGRNGSGGFMMESPLANGTLDYSRGVGMNVTVNRNISSIDSRAQFNYNVTNQSISTQLSHKIAPHLDLTFGTTQNPLINQTDQQAKIEYRIDF